MIFVKDSKIGIGGNKIKTTTFFGKENVDEVMESMDSIYD